MAEHNAKTRLIRASLPLLVASSLTACGGDSTFLFPVPAEPFESILFDLVTGPLDRPSAFDLVAARGRGLPRTVRVDQTEQWDIAFAILEGEPVWLPRGFFEGIRPSSGITRLDGDFDDITSVPGNSEEYEEEEPVPISEGAVYAIRSRTDPALSLPCRVFGKVRVLLLEGIPPQIDFETVWNPNCDDTNVDQSQ